jgi:hypothetical protein
MFGLSNQRRRPRTKASPLQVLQEITTVGVSSNADARVSTGGLAGATESAPDPEVTNETDFMQPFRTDDDHYRGVKQLLCEIQRTSRGRRRGLLLQTLANALDQHVIVDEEVVFPSRSLSRHAA